MLSVDPTITTQNNTNTTFKAGRKIKEIIKNPPLNPQEVKLLDNLGFNVVKKLELIQMAQTDPDRVREIIMRERISNVLNDCKSVLDVIV